MYRARHTLCNCFTLGQDGYAARAGSGYVAVGHDTCAALPSGASQRRPGTGRAGLHCERYAT
eukprot:6178497-Pleurochrysis_carterae.AAC.3